MKVKNGFVPLFFLFIFVAGGLTAAYAGYSIFRPKKPEIKGVVVIIPSTTPSPTFSLTPIPEKIIVPTSTPIQPTTVSSSVIFRIDDNGLAISDSSLSLNIKDENSGKEQSFKNESSAWSITNLSPGKYRFSVSFPKDRYFNPQKNCEGCQNVQDISNFDTCGYIIDFSPGDNVKISCMLRTTQPLPSQIYFPPSGTPTDTVPPTTNIYYPSQNGTITYKIDGKICAIASPPNDNVNNSNEIETEYKFDDTGWSGYATVRAYLCVDALSNGQHTLTYHSKDKAGNVETTKTIQFTVNIPGN